MLASALPGPPPERGLQSRGSYGRGGEVGQQLRAPGKCYRAKGRVAREGKAALSQSPPHPLCRRTGRQAGKVLAEQTGAWKGGMGKNEHRHTQDMPGWTDGWIVQVNSVGQEGRPMGQVGHSPSSAPDVHVLALCMVLENGLVQVETLG